MKSEIVQTTTTTTTSGIHTYIDAYKNNAKHYVSDDRDKRELSVGNAPIKLWSLVENGDLSKCSTNDFNNYLNVKFAADPVEFPVVHDRVLRSSQPKPRRSILSLNIGQTTNIPTYSTVQTNRIVPYGQDCKPYRQ